MEGRGLDSGSGGLDRSSGEEVGQWQGVELVTQCCAMVTQQY